MCVAIPGRVAIIERASEAESLMGRVDFSGISKEVCLAYLPDVEVGDYVLVHAGFALSKIDETEAALLLSDLEEIKRLGES